MNVCGEEFGEITRIEEGWRGAEKGHQIVAAATLCLHAVMGSRFEQADGISPTDAHKAAVSIVTLEPVYDP